MNAETKKEIEALLMDAAAVAERLRELGSSQELRDDHKDDMYWGAAHIDNGVGVIQTTFGWEE